MRLVRLLTFCYWCCLVWLMVELCSRYRLVSSTAAPSSNLRHPSHAHHAIPQGGCLGIACLFYFVTWLYPLVFFQFDDSYGSFDTIDRHRVCLVSCPYNKLYTRWKQDFTFAVDSFKWVNISTERPIDIRGNVHLKHRIGCFSIPLYNAKW